MKLTMVVEWTIGSRERYDWRDGALVARQPWGWELSPVNYGCIPGYFNPADRAELDAIWCDPVPIALGVWLEGEVLGMVWLSDLDHKILLGRPGDLEKLDRAGLEAWFVGREARIAAAEEALAIIASLLTKA
jgi:inorganic pyrophosphatase